MLVTKALLLSLLVLLSGDPDEWEENMQVNLIGPMRLTRRLSPPMAEKGEGYHINISSSAGKHPSPKQCAYAAAKWGMTGFALSSAKVLGTIMNGAQPCTCTKARLQVHQQSLRHAAGSLSIIAEAHRRQFGGRKGGGEGAD